MIITEWYNGPVGLHNDDDDPYPYSRLKIKLRHRNMSTRDKTMIKQTKATESV